jgi:Cys-tRNA(Pro)/Cys-tRNA(Cys) deacylase
VLTKAAVPFSVHRYDPDPNARTYGEAAAQALGVQPERIFKTLVATVDGELVVAVVPVAGTLDLKALASLRGAKRAAMAEPPEVERATGYVVGGISPLGQRRTLPTVVDESALAFDTVFFSAGRRGMQIETAPRALVELTGASTARIAKR